MKKISLTKDDIKSIIPHREPMLMVDAVEEMSPGKKITTTLYLDPKFDYFKGHFPNEPVMPGVLTIESMAQTACVLMLSEDRYRGSSTYLIGIDNVRFHKKIKPGDKITIEARMLNERQEKAIVTCEAIVHNGSDISTTGLITLALR